MKRVKLDIAGGFPLKQKTIDYVQSNVNELMQAFVGFLDLPPVGNFILSGCEILANSINPGITYIDGTICPFDGLAVGTNIKLGKVESNEAVSFKNGSSNTVYFEAKALAQNQGVDLTQFIRVELNWNKIKNKPNNIENVQADWNITAIESAAFIKNKPEGIVNIQGDWSETDQSAGAFIKNKPKTLNYLAKGSVDIVAPDANGVGTQVVYVANLPNQEYIVITNIKYNQSGSPLPFLNLCTMNYEISGFTIYYKIADIATQVAAKLEYIIIPLI